jgi:hypothetical protein
VIVMVNPAKIRDTEVVSALAYINRRRVAVQAPLERVGDIFASRANPGEVWSVDDVLTEARRTGWRP